MKARVEAVEEVAVEVAAGHLQETARSGTRPWLS